MITSFACRPGDASKYPLHPSTSQSTGGETFDPSTFADQPPVSNTGAEITNAPTENRVLFDFVSLTFPQEETPDKVLEMIGLDTDLFSPCPTGSMGYKQSMRFGHISVLFDGSSGMGVHVSMSGQGCREYEAQYTSCPWLSLFENVLGHNGQFTRLDIAIDNIDGQLDLDKLEAQINEKRIRSRFKKGRKISEFSLRECDDDSNGKTLYIGSAQSRLQIRFYDKAAQLGCDKFWTRAEIQLRSERAQVVAQHYVSNLEPSQIAVGILNTYFTPINLDDSNKTRCSTQEWWLSWLQSTEKLKLTIEKAKKTIQQIADYIRRQYAPTLAMLKEYFKHDFNEFVRGITDEGEARMGLKHYQILASSV